MTTGEKVALKILKKSALDKMDDSTRRQVTREMDAMKAIDHPNVLRCKHVDWEAQYDKKNGKSLTVVLVVLELAQGGELFDYLSFTGPFQEDLARSYFHQLMAGVGACHSAGIAHRDLKPENLLMDKHFVLKLADFGFAAGFDADTGKSVMFTECGTLGYMAPEMFSARSGYDARKTDVWACGVILFTMLAGFPPFQKPDKSDWWFNKLQAKKYALFWKAHERSVKFSDSAKQIINAMLTVEHADRPLVPDLCAMPWAKGKVFAPAVLAEQLDTRRQTVQRAKLREKHLAAAHADNDMDTGLDRTTVRAVGASGSGRAASDDLPAGPPATGHFKLPVRDSGGGFGGGGGFGAMSAALSAEEPAPVVMLKYNPAQEVYTQFETTAGPEEIVRRLKSPLEHSDGITLFEDKEQAQIKVELMTQSGVLALTMQVYAKESDKHMVVFRRLKGDAATFRSLFHQMSDRLSDLIEEEAE